MSKEKDELMAIVSHDLKNPLAVIDISMQLLSENEKKLGPSSYDLIKRTKASANFALNLITDLLDLARLEGGIKLAKEPMSVWPEPT